MTLVAFVDVLMVVRITTVTTDSFEENYPIHGRNLGILMRNEKLIREIYMDIKCCIRTHRIT